MKKLISITSALAIALASITSAAETNNGNFGFSVGYTGIGLGDEGSFTHDTHPADRGFVPNGNAGETSVDFVNLVTLGALYQQNVSDFSFRFEAGVMATEGRDCNQNRLDTRPAANGSFQYSEVSSWGFYGAIGVSYNIQSIKGLSVGADAQIMSIGISHGYNRYGADEEVKSETLWIPTIAPKIEYNFGDGLILQVAVPIGKTVGGQIKFVYLF